MFALQQPEGGQLLLLRSLEALQSCERIDLTAHGMAHVPSPWAMISHGTQKKLWTVGVCQQEQDLTVLTSLKQES